MMIWVKTIVVNFKELYEVVFFSRKRDLHGAKEMFNIFKNYEIIDEVVIPPRRDKRKRI